MNNSLPETYIYVFKDGDQFCAVYNDFKNLQESSAGFGPTIEKAVQNLQESPATTSTSQKEPAALEQPPGESVLLEMLRDAKKAKYIAWKERDSWKAKVEVVEIWWGKLNKLHIEKCEQVRVLTADNVTKAARIKELELQEGWLEHQISITSKRYIEEYDELATQLEEVKNDCERKQQVIDELGKDLLEQSEQTIKFEKYRQCVEATIALNESTLKLASTNR